MACMKCGKKTKDDQVFCPDCLKVMEAYPVKRDIHIQLPNRPTHPVSKRSGKKRRNLTPEEQVAYLQSRVRRQKFTIALLFLLLICALIALLYFTGEVDRLLELVPNYPNK